MVKGMNRSSGLSIEGDDHISQSIRDILITPIGSRVMLPEYGSRLLDYLDAPDNESTRIGVIAASAEALQRWEKRIQLMKIQVTRQTPDASLEIEATYIRKDGDGLSDVSRVVL